MYSLTSGIQVKPAKFEYHAVDSLEEAVSLLSRYEGEARLLAGGQSLIPMMNFRLAAPRALVDLNRVPRLQAIREEDGVGSGRWRAKGRSNFPSASAACFHH